MLQRLRPHLRHAPFILLAVVLGVVDILLLAGAAGALGKAPDPAVQAVQVREVNLRMESLRKQIAEQQLPPTSEVENLILSLSKVADEMHVVISGFSSTRRPEKLGERSYTLAENTLELRGEASDLVQFLKHLQEKTLETLELRNINLRAETGTGAGGWVLHAQVRILTELAGKP